MKGGSDPRENSMKSVFNRLLFFCPYHINRLTGSPIRATEVIKAAKHICRDVQVIAMNGVLSDTKVYRLVDVMKQGGSGTLPWKTALFWWACLSLLPKLRPDVVHMFDPFVGGVPLSFLKQRLECKVVAEIHGVAEFQSRTAGSGSLARVYMNLIESHSLKHSDAIIAVSNRMKEWLIRSGIAEEKITVIYEPVDIDFVQNFSGDHVKSRLNIEGKSVIGYFGNDMPWQGIPTLFKATDIILSKTTDVVFLLVGLPRAKYANYENTYRRFLGQVPRNEVFHYMAACDAVISPRIRAYSTEFQFPHKIAEAFACGKPVVATAVGEQEDVVRESKAGFVVRPDDPGALANGILQISALSREEIDNMGANALEYAKRHMSLEITTAKLQEVYGKL